MAINTLAFANALTEELDKATVQSAVTGFMADNALRTKFVGARTVLIPHVEMDGLGDYDRDSGFARGAVTLSSQSCVLAMDRARTFQIDREDNDETGIAGLAGELRPCPCCRRRRSHGCSSCSGPWASGTWLWWTIAIR